jgi:hypothetical protein
MIIELIKKNNYKCDYKINIMIQETVRQEQLFRQLDFKRLANNPDFKENSVRKKLFFL